MLASGFQTAVNVKKTNIDTLVVNWDQSKKHRITSLSRPQRTDTPASWPFNSKEVEFATRTSLASAKAI